jgi:3-mercaptopyruvate sulfurtransferase SseA
MTRVRWATVLALTVLASGALSTGHLTPAVFAQADAARISLAEFKKLLDQDKVVVLDVRGADAYRAGHIPGAVLVPLETVAGRAAEYAKVAKPIVTYCA